MDCAVSERGCGKKAPLFELTGDSGGMNERALEFRPFILVYWVKTFVCLGDMRS